jgi:hypothetical protein
MPTRHSGGRSPSSEREQRDERHDGHAASVKVTAGLPIFRQSSTSMKHPVWERLPNELRFRVDELIAQGRWVRAAGEIRDTVDQPCPGIRECMDLLADRYAELGQPWFSGCPPLNIDVLARQVAALPHPPDAIEALWDRDTEGWFVRLVAVTLRPKLEHNFPSIRRGTVMRLFNGEVRPWRQALEATPIGRALADRLCVPFHFASPDTPNMDLPRWSP